ncbi:MAG TPA: rRNA maturation RNase YbeY [Opitutaceae bacterium]
MSLAPILGAREITLHSAYPGLKFDRRAILRVIQILDTHADKFRGGCPPGELSLALLTDSALAKLHADFLDDPTTTDVITFEGDSAFGVAGEICVSVDTARAYAKKHQRDFHEELTLYLVHGWLHLAGYDDLVPAKKRLMRAAEKRAMRFLQEEDAVPVFSIRPKRRKLTR